MIRPMLKSPLLDSCSANKAGVLACADVVAVRAGHLLDVGASEKRTPRRKMHRF